MLTEIRRVIAAILLLVVLTTEAWSQLSDSVYRSPQTSTGIGLPVALKTNLAYDLLLVPNIGVQVGLGRQWALAADWMYAWWSNDSRHRYWQTYGGYVTLRKYFSPRASQSSLAARPFSGHHLGVYVLGMTYDVEWGGRGYQAARFGFGGGLEYGYSMPIGRRLNLDLSLGVGFQDGEYKEYDPKDGHYVWQATRKRHWYGPTKAEVSLVWLLGKGGRQ